MLNRLFALPVAVVIAVIGNTGICADAGAGKHRDRMIPLEKLCQLNCVFICQFNHGYYCTHTITGQVVAYEN